MSRAEAEQINEEGIELLQDEKVEDAVTKFLKAIEVDETYAFPYCHIGNVLAAANKQEESLDWFQKAIELDEEMATAYYSLGSALFDLEKWDEALHMYQKAEQKGLVHADLYFMMGMSHRNKGEGQETRALAYFQRAIDEDPDDMEAIFQRGLCAALLGHLEQAKQDFKEVVAADDQHADAHFNLGVAYAYENKEAKSLEHLDKAIAIQPNHALALHARKQIKGE